MHDPSNATFVIQVLKPKVAWLAMRRFTQVKNNTNVNTVKRHLDIRHIEQNMRIFMNKITNFYVRCAAENISKVETIDCTWGRTILMTMLFRKYTRTILHWYFISFAIPSIKFPFISKNKISKLLVPVGSQIKDFDKQNNFVLVCPAASRLPKLALSLWQIR